MSWIHTNYIKYPESKLKLGHKRVSNKEIYETVKRLTEIKIKPNADEERFELDEPIMTSKDIKNMLQRLADKDKNLHRTPERCRTGSYEQLGLVNSYAWIDGRILQGRLNPVADGNYY